MVADLVVVGLGTWLLGLLGVRAPCIPSSVLWLVAISFLPSVRGVCQHCFGGAHGCDGTGDSCPWHHLVAANAAAVGAAVGGAVSVAKILPSKFLRVFPRSALDSIAALCVKVKAAGAPFEPLGKTTAEVLSAVKAGLFSKSEAVLRFNTLITCMATDVMH